MPPAPENLQIFSGEDADITLEWDQPDIDDFDYFNIYWSTDGGNTYNLLDYTVGVQYFYSVPSNGVYYFYITVMDQAAHESAHSNIVQADINVGIEDPVVSGDLSMIKLGPNPFDRQLNIDVRIAKERGLEVYYRLEDVPRAENL